MQTVDVIAFVVMDLPAVVGGELAASGFGVLACDPSDQGGWFVVRLDHLLYAMIKANLI